MKHKLYLSWDLLIEKGKELMEIALQEGNKPDLITELTSWLDSVVWEYSDDYDIIVEGCDFRTFKLRSYEDIISFIEEYEEELRYDEELFYEELEN